MDKSDKFYKKNKNDKVWWKSHGNETVGDFIFSFDKETTFNLFLGDYPSKLTKRQKQIFDEENPFWADFFKEE